MESQTIVANLKATAQRYKDNEAIVYKDRRVTYSQLWFDVCRIADFLKQNGLQDGDRVTLVVENSPEFVASYYAVLAAKGVVVALNTAAKHRDIANWLNHCGANWLIIDEKHGEFAQLHETFNDEINLLIVPKDSDSLNTVSSNNWREVNNSYTDSTIPLDIDPNKPAAIIYTSGTTGTPKGVTLSHINLSSNVSSIVAYLGLVSDDRILNILPFYYSYGNSVLHTHLAAGATVILENSLTYPHVILEKIVAERATAFSGVPSTFTLLLRRVDFNNYDLSSLRYITQAGGPMTPHHIKQITDFLPDASFFVMYGQTEATARISYLPPEQLFEKLGSVGIPIPGEEIEIRNNKNQAVKVNEKGEIYVSGDNVMLGYWRNEALTSEVIVDGWLKTGDLAYKDEDGYVYITGRSSDMMKVGAHRISPKEIEEVISEIPAVSEVAVVGVPDPMLGECIKAVVIPNLGVDLSKREIMAHCKKNLAIYKLPKLVVFTTELPKTASGKVRRFMLIDID